MIRAAMAVTMLALAPALAAAQDQITLRFHGYAFDLETDRYLYTEVHEAVIAAGKWTRGRIAYHGPDGGKLGEKTLDFSVDPFVPLYDYRLPALGYGEAITAIGRTISLHKTRDGRTRSASVPKNDPITADAGFHNFLRAHFRELLDGKTLAFTFVAAGNLDSYRFRARRVEDTVFEGRKAVRFRVEANSLLRVVAPDLLLTYDPDLQRLLEYRGPSNVIDPATGKVYDARVAYYSRPPQSAPRDLPPLQ